MNLPAAGTSKSGLFSQEDYLAPLPIPTGKKAVDAMNVIWRKSNVFLDVGSYSIGSGVMVLWVLTVIFIGVAYISSDKYVLWLGACITLIPSLMLIRMLYRPTPLPIRFNRQRREVCVPREGSEYWIVPWEKVTAAATQHSSVSQAGRNTTGMLFIGFDNPDPLAKADDQHATWGFNCGGGETAMALWECVRSYMEIGPDAVPESRVGEVPYEETQLGSIITSLRKGDVIGVLHGLLFITVFGTYLAEKLQDLKLSSPPDFDHPDIIEWSKPLPPEQWAKRSPELEAAIAQREAELAALSI